MSDQSDVPPIPMRLTCPECGQLHVDAGKFATKPHHTHSCQHCGHTWRPAVVHTVGVRFLPGFRDAEAVSVEERKQDSFGSAGNNKPEPLGLSAKAPVQPNEVSKVIRSGDLEEGKHYRIVEIDSDDKGPRHAMGEVVTCIDANAAGDGIYCNFGYGVWFAGKGATGTYVTAVELVDEPEQSAQPVAPLDRCSVCGAEVKPPLGTCECKTSEQRDSHVKRITEAVAKSSPGEDNNLTPSDLKRIDNARERSMAFARDLILAVDGAPLEPGSYESVEVAKWSNGGVVGDWFEIPPGQRQHPCKFAYQPHFGGPAYTVVRKADPTIIHAKEGVALEAGEYVDAEDATRELKTPILMSVEAVSDFGRWVFRFGPTRRDWVTAVRRVEKAGEPKPELSETLARLFHEIYERLAPSHGYATRERSAVPWADVPPENKSLMVATCSEVLRALKAERSVAELELDLFRRNRELEDCRGEWRKQERRFTEENATLRTRLEAAERDFGLQREYWNDSEKRAEQAEQEAARLGERVAELVKLRDEKISSLDDLIHNARAERDHAVELLRQQNARCDELTEKLVTFEREAPHLKKAARLLLSSHGLGLIANNAYGDALDKWIEAERVRESEPAREKEG